MVYRGTQYWNHGVGGWGWQLFTKRQTRELPTCTMSRVISRGSGSQTPWPQSIDLTLQVAAMFLKQKVRYWFPSAFMTHLTTGILDWLSLRLQRILLPASFWTPLNYLLWDLGENGCWALALNTHILHVKEAYMTCTPNTKPAPMQGVWTFSMVTTPLGEGEVHWICLLTNSH